MPFSHGIVLRLGKNHLKRTSYPADANVGLLTSENSKTCNFTSRMADVRVVCASHRFPTTATMRNTDLCHPIVDCYTAIEYL